MQLGNPVHSYVLALPDRVIAVDCVVSLHCQVSIPEDAQRRNDSVKEEIVIPHTSTAPPPVGENCIKISELDDIAQVAFQRTTHLNRIQSVVFDAAYYSNENLLISAPTGAGKTNIAMLTVLHEIKNNISDSGVIKRDNFKVTQLTRVQ